MHHSTLFQYAIGGFIVGVALASFFVFPVIFLWVCVAIAGGFLLARRPMLWVSGVFLLAAVFGVWRTVRVIEAPSILADKAAGAPLVAVVGYADGNVTPTAHGIQYPFHVTRIDMQDDSIMVDDRIIVFGPDTIKPQYGQVLLLTGKIQQAKNSGDFDYRSYLAKEGVHALMYFPSYSVPLDWQPSSALTVKLSLIGALHRMRDTLAASIARSVAQPEASYLAGILVGAQGIVSADIKDMFARTGTSHILAISGYNITIVAIALAGLLAPLGRRRAFWFSLLGIGVFTVMVGAGASVVRAAVMGALALVARYLGRQSQIGVAILLSGAMMCLLNPLLLRWDVGFQLSFLALIGIVYGEPILAPLLTRLVRWPWLASTAATTISASVAVLPLLLYNFGQLAIYTLPANLLVLPLVPLAMALGLATGVSGLVLPFMGQLIGQSAWLVAAFQLGIVRFFAGLPHAALAIPISGAAVCAGYAALATWLGVYYRKDHA